MAAGLVIVATAFKLRDVSPWSWSWHFKDSLRTSYKSLVLALTVEFLALALRVVSLVLVIEYLVMVLRVESLLASLHLSR